MLSIAPVHANGVPSVVWLPPLSNQELFQLKDGSTLPIKFTLLGPEGSFVIDETVKVAVNKVLFRDYFDEPDGLPSNWYTYSGIWTVESCELSGTTSGVTGEGWTWAEEDAITTRLYVSGNIAAKFKIDFKAKPADSVGRHGGVMFYASDPTQRWAISGYTIDWIDRTSDHGYRIYRWDSGSYTLLGRFDGGVSDPGTNWRIQVDDSTITLFVDGAFIGSVTDSTYREGYFGLWLYRNNQHAHFDDVLVLEADPVKEFTYGEGSDNVRIYEDEGAYTLFSDTFSAEGGTQPDQTWQVINGEWQTLDYEYQQTGNVYIPGARSFAGDTAWKDYIMMARVKISDDGWGGLLLRGNTAGDTYYELYLQRGGYLQLVKTVGGSRTWPGGTWTDPQFRVSVGDFADEWWYIKAVVSGNNIKGKAWPVTGSEPTSWHINWNDPDPPIANGRIGLITFSWWDTQLPVWFDDVTVQVGYYIANLHTKENGMTEGEYAITVWYQGQYPIEDTYLFDLVDTVQGKGRGKGKA